MIIGKMRHHYTYILQACASIRTGQNGYYCKCKIYIKRNNRCCMEEGYEM